MERTTAARTPSIDVGTDDVISSICNVPLNSTISSSDTLCSKKGPSKTSHLRICNDGRQKSVKMSLCSRSALEPDVWM